MDLSAVDRLDRGAVVDLARQVLDHAGLSPSRVGSIVDALTSVLAYATWQRPADPPSQERSARRPPEPPCGTGPRPVESTARAAGDGQARTPTFTMLALGARVDALMERIIVIAFVLTAIGLALALA